MGIGFSVGLISFETSTTFCSLFRGSVVVVAAGWSFGDGSFELLPGGAALSSSVVVAFVEAFPFFLEAGLSLLSSSLPFLSSSIEASSAALALAAAASSAAFFFEPLGARFFGSGLGSASFFAALGFLFFGAGFSVSVFSLDANIDLMSILPESVFFKVEGVPLIFEASASNLSCVSNSGPLSSESSIVITS